MNIQEYKKLEPGDKVDYLRVRGVTFVKEIRGTWVRIRDKTGFEKNLWKPLFLKHAVIPKGPN